MLFVLFGNSMGLEVIGGLAVMAGLKGRMGVKGFLREDLMFTSPGIEAVLSFGAFSSFGN